MPNIFSVRNYTLTGFNKKIQLICFYDDSSTLSKPKKIEDILPFAFDTAGCVSYTIIKGQKIFRIPEKGREFIFAKRTPRNTVDMFRHEKYRIRGYNFY